MAEANANRRLAALKAWQTRRARKLPSAAQAALLRLMVKHPNETLNVGYFNTWISWITFGDRKRREYPQVTRLTFEVILDRRWIMLIDSTPTTTASSIVKHYMITDLGREAIGKGDQ